MAKLTIYHNNKCSKSRETLDLLRGAGAAFEVIEYLTVPPSVDELDRLLTQLGMEPHEIARSKEARFKDLGLDKKAPASRKEWLKVLIENPILIERPIVTDGKRAVIGRPPENVKTLLKR